MTIAVWGKGRPDYSQNVDRAIVRKGLTFQYQESQKTFILSLQDGEEDTMYPFVRPALEPGETASVIDASTGLAAPFTVPEGYIMNVKYYSISLSGLSCFKQYLDEQFVQQAYYHDLDIYFEQEIYAIGTELIDPTGTTSHTWRLSVTNVGNSILAGIIGVVGILRAVGTKPMTTKTIKCRACDSTQEVPYETSSWTCPNGHKNIYMVFSPPKGGN